MKKLFILILAIAVFVLSSIGCMQRPPFEITEDIWDKDKESVNTSYTDTVVSFYSSKTGHELVFLGEKYHYIFDQGAYEFAELLKSKDFLDLKQKNFEINAELDTDDNRVIKLNISSVIPSSELSNAQKDWLATHKFIPKDKEIYVGQVPDPLYVSSPTYRNITVYQKSFLMIGKRYISNQELNAKAIKLKQARRLRVHGHKYQDKSMLKQIAMTPLALVGDTALNIIVVGVNIILSPLYMLMIF